MGELTLREIELVALVPQWAATAPSIEYQIPEVPKAGLTDSQIRAVIERADTVRQIPARKVLDAAMETLGASSGTGKTETDPAGRFAGATAGGGRCGC